MWFKKEIIKEILVNEVDTLSTEQLEKELLERYGDLPKEIVDKELEKKIIEDLKNIDGFNKYLQALMNQDIIRYFGAQDEASRNQTRGAFHRTLYLKNKVKAKPKLDKVDNKRYK